MVKGLAAAAAVLALSACQGQADGGTVAAATDCGCGPSPAPVEAATWGPASCSWALSNLQNDIELDQGAVDRGGPNRAAYAAYVDHWTRIRATVQARCGQGAPPSIAPVSCSTAQDWLAIGIQGHVNDMARANATAWDRSWDQPWIAFYRSLSGKFAVGCGA